MSLASIPDYEFIAYIDEAGDPGLKNVRPIDDRGSTEWMTVSAAVICREREQEAIEWVAKINKTIGVENTQVIHFKDLTREHRLTVCEELAKLPVRLFVVATNKKNMRRHQNDRAAKVPSKQWFYNWIVRILIERVTHWCGRRADRHKLARRHVKFVFSQSGGHSYSQTAAYHELLKKQARGGKPYLSKWVPRWDVMSMHLVENYPHYKRAGLQLADVTASSFYQAIDNLDTGPCETSYAKALRPRMAHNVSGYYDDYGVVLQPTPCWTAEISSDQREIFEFYDYDFMPPMRWQAPAPVSSRSG
ncbi:DUF3800 domain-containing protein [Agrobacterium tumefaciens]|uniref:DUF3800 domain-containing protein n=1 Tax=Agrobacterium tumefaciens TaxID=358 RepID=UPI001FFCED86|nr:DUF3800 domain-containing protein [Agrobacterium tumefaciens]